jgi:hypothetical protein
VRHFGNTHPNTTPIEHSDPSQKNKQKEMEKVHTLFGDKRRFVIAAAAAAAAASVIVAIAAAAAAAAATGNEGNARDEGGARDERDTRDKRAKTIEAAVGGSRNLRLWFLRHLKNHNRRTYKSSNRKW